MAGRSARPAVLTVLAVASGVVRVAAVLLGLFGLLLVLVEADQGDLDATELVTALVLVSAAAALVWAGRLGYWVGLAAAGLIAVLLVVVLARRPGVAGLVVTASCALPLVLGGAGGPPPLPGHQASTVAGGPRAQPPGWTRPIAGWGQVAFPGRRRGAVERWGAGDGSDRSGCRRGGRRHRPVVLLPAGGAVGCSGGGGAGCGWRPWGWATATNAASWCPPPARGWRSWLPPPPPGPGHAGRCRVRRCLCRRPRGVAVAAAAGRGGRGGVVRGGRLHRRPSGLGPPLAAAAVPFGGGHRRRWGADVVPWRRSSSSGPPR